MFNDGLYDAQIVVFNMELRRLFVQRKDDPVVNGCPFGFTGIFCGFQPSGLFVFVVVMVEQGGDEAGSLAAVETTIGL